MNGPTNNGWHSVKADPPPQGAVIETKLHDERGEGNHGKLKLIDGLWWFPDMSMYVYYTPTHWKPL